jgi:AIPR protein
MSSGTLSEPIVVEFDEPLPCLATPETDPDFSVFLTILPGSTLSGLYGQYGTRLLELNVRSFLQAKGAVNRGSRDTLLTDPERFLAYNNGITRQHRRSSSRRFRAAARLSAGSTTCRSSTAGRLPRRSITPTSGTRPTSPGFSSR